MGTDGNRGVIEEHGREVGLLSSRVPGRLACSMLNQVALLDKLPQMDFGRVPVDFQHRHGLGDGEPAAFFCHDQ